MMRNAFPAKHEMVFRPSRNPRVLLVDDDSSVRESVGLALESENFEIIPAANSHEALDKYFEGSIDLVLLDLDMPEAAGWDTFERLTALNPYLPVILVAEHLDPRERAAVAGAAAILGKPLNIPALIQIINRVAEEPIETRARRAAVHRSAVLAGGR